MKFTLSDRAETTELEIIVRTQLPLAPQGGNLASFE